MYGLLVFKYESTGFGSFSLGLLLVVSVFSSTYGQTGPSCNYGSYNDAGKTCCLCPKGYHIVKPCTTQDPWPQCDICPTGAYTSEANSKESCEPCHVCRSQAYLEVEKPCTSTSNAVCRCKSGHFCEAEECKACQPCNKCEWGEKEPCTSRKNTVCKESPVPGIAVSVVLSVVVVVAGVIAFLLWQRKKLCFADKNDGDPHEFKPLAGIDLMQVLDDIVTHLSWNDMVKVAYKTGMTEAEVERHQMNHPSNSEEQTRSLLQEWIERQGLTNATETLCKTLRKCNLVRKADKIKHVITTKTINNDDV